MKRFNGRGKPLWLMTTSMMPIPLAMVMVLLRVNRCGSEIIGSGIYFADDYNDSGWKGREAEDMRANMRHW